MIMRGRHRSGGFSLVELLVVLAIVGILMGSSIPVLRMFSQNDMDRGARSLYTMIRAARVYASTYNVETAIAYQLDGDPAGSPVMDSLRRQSVRDLRGAMILYKLPANLGVYSNLYVPTVENGGEFQPFQTGYSVLLDVPPTDFRKPPQGIGYVYGLKDPPADNSVFQGDFGGNISALGMMSVPAYLGTIGGRPPQPAANASDVDKQMWKAWQDEFDSSAVVAVLAHVFDTGGKLDLGGSGSTTQRFSILFAPSPDRPVAERTWSTGDLNDNALDQWLAGAPTAPEMGLVGIPIEIYRSTGRVRMGSL